MAKLRRVVPSFGAGWAPHEKFGPISTNNPPTLALAIAPLWVYYPPNSIEIIKSAVQANWMPASQIVVAFSASGTVVWTDSGAGTVPPITTTVTISKSWSHTLSQVTDVDPSTNAGADEFQWVSILGTTLLAQFSDEATTSVSSLTSFATQGGASVDVDVLVASLTFNRAANTRPSASNLIGFSFEVDQSEDSRTINGTGNNDMLNFAADTAILKVSDQNTTSGSDHHNPAGVYTTSSTWSDSTSATPYRGTYDRSATLSCTVTVSV